MTITAYTDGASRGNPGESGFGFILKDDQGNILHAESGYLGKATNNVAEYQALLACLRKVLKMECTSLVVHSDSELMVRQLHGTYRVKDTTLKKYYQSVRELLFAAPFSFRIVHIERELNRDADRLANEGIDRRLTVPA